MCLLRETRKHVPVVVFITLRVISAFGNYVCYSMEDGD